MLERKRKFLIAAAALVMSFALALLGKLAGGEWVTVTSFIVGLYGFAEMGEAALRSKKNGN